MYAVNCLAAWIICANIYVLTSANRRENETINVHIVKSLSMDHRCSSKYEFALTEIRLRSGEHSEYNLVSQFV